MEELLRMEHISKRFGDFYANHDVNLSVAKGEVHTLLGENGAGKSTLMNILIGLYQPTEGSIFLNGRQVRIESPSQAVKLGIGMVHQHFMLVEAMTVFENMILGDRNPRVSLSTGRRGGRRSFALSEKYGLDVELDKLITEISVGAQQRVEILKALYHGAELLILDEPSAALTDIEVEGLFAIMKKLVSEGKSIIFISHKMREVLHISDRITILRAGEVVTTVDAHGVTGQELANMMIGRELQQSQYEKKDVEAGAVISCRTSTITRNPNTRDSIMSVSLSAGARSSELPAWTATADAARAAADGVLSPESGEFQRKTEDRGLQPAGLDRGRRGAHPGGPESAGPDRQHVDRGQSCAQADRRAAIFLTARPAYEKRRPSRPMPGR